MSTKNMSSRQLLKYAKENGHDSVMFSVKKNGTHTVTGKFLDAWYEFVRIPVLGNGFTRISDLEEQLGYDITFDVLTEEEFKNGVRLDFLLRGQNIPKEYLWSNDDNEEDVLE